MAADLTLYQLGEEFLLIEEALYDSDGELTPEIEKRMNAIGELTAAKLDNISRFIHIKENKSQYLADQIKRLQALKKVEDNSEKRLKQYVLDFMSMRNIRKIEGNECRLSIRSSESVDVDSETVDRLTSDVRNALIDAHIPDYVEVDVKISKTRLKAMMAGGITPSGVCRVRKESLLVK